MPYLAILSALGLIIAGINQELPQATEVLEPAQAPEVLQSGPAPEVPAASPQFGAPAIEETPEVREVAPVPASSAVQGIPTVDGILTIRCEMQPTAEMSASVSVQQLAETEGQIEGKRKTKQKKGKGKGDAASPVSELAGAIAAADMRWTYRLQGEEASLMTGQPCKAGESVALYRVGTTRQIATFHGSDFTDVYFLEPTLGAGSDDQNTVASDAQCKPTAAAGGVGMRISGKKIKVKIDFAKACSRFFVVTVNNKVTDFLLAEREEYSLDSPTWHCRATFNWDTVEYEVVTANPNAGKDDSQGSDTNPNASPPPPAPSVTDCVARFNKTIKSDGSGDQQNSDRFSEAEAGSYVPALGIKTPAGVLRFQCLKNETGGSVLTAVLEDRQIGMGSCTEPGQWSVARLASPQPNANQPGIAADLPLIFSAPDYLDLFLSVDGNDRGHDLIALRLFKSGQVGISRIDGGNDRLTAITQIRFPDARRSEIELDGEATIYKIDWAALRPGLSSDTEPSQTDDLGVLTCRDATCEWSEYSEPKSQ